MVSGEPPLTQHRQDQRAGGGFRNGLIEFSILNFVINLLWQVIQWTVLIL